MQQEEQSKKETVVCQACLDHLSKMAPEFDEEALKNHDRLHFQYENGVGEHGIRYRCLKEGARWQFDQMKAMLAEKDIDRNEYKKFYEMAQAKIHEQRALLELVLKRINRIANLDFRTYLSHIHEPNEFMYSNAKGLALAEAIQYAKSIVSTISTHLGAEEISHEPT